MALDTLPQGDPPPPGPPGAGLPLGVPSAPPVLDSLEARDALDCPLCGYSLRGLATATEPRCPECGYQLDWVQLLAARQNLHPYLFEHHKPGNVRSFLLTLWHGLRPAKFWSGLNAAHEVRPGRLVVYCFLVTLLVAASLWVGWYFAHLGALFSAATTGWTPVGGYMRWQRLTSSSRLVSMALALDRRDSIQAHFLLTLFTWPWLTLAALLLFQVSMRRARIDFGHVLRCVVYSFDAFLWMFAFGLLAGLVVALGPTPSRMRFANAAEDYLVIGLIAAVVLATYRLGQAYRRYLRFENPWGTAILSQVLVVLTVLTALAAFDPAFWELFW